MRVVAFGAELLAAMTGNLDLTLKYRACLQFFMAVEAYTPHILRTQQQLPGWHIRRMNFMFRMSDRRHPIPDRKRHGFFGWVIACRTGVTDFTTRARFINHTLNCVVSGRFTVDAGGPLCVPRLVALLARSRTI